MGHRFLLVGILVFLLLFFSNPDSLRAQSLNERAWLIIQEAEKEYGEAALPGLQQARQLCQQGCADSVMARLYRRLGVAYFQGYIDDEALACTDTSIQYYLSAYGPSHPDVANAYYNSGLIAKSLGRLKQASQQISQAIDQIENNETLSPEKIDEIRAGYYRSLTELYIRMGDYATARLYAQRGLNIAAAPSLNRARLLDNLGFVAYEQRNYPQAISYYRNAIKAYLASSESPQRYLIAIQENLALAYMQTGALARAEEHLMEVQSYYQSISPDDFQKRQSFYQVRRSNTRSNLMLLCVKQGRYQEAEAHFVEAINQLEEAGVQSQHPLFTELFYQRALAAQAQQRPKQVLQFCEDALTHLPQLPRQNGSPQQLTAENLFQTIAILALKAETLAADQAEDALHAYQQISALVNNIRFKFRFPLSKSYLIQAIRPIYEDAIGLCHELFQRTEDQQYLETAYAFNAANKSIFLFEELQAAQAIQFAGIPADVLDEEKNLRRTIHQTQLSLSELDLSSTQADSLQTVLINQQADYDLFLNQLEIAHPRYYELKYQPIAAVSLNDIQSQLAKDQAFLEYFLGTDQLFLFHLNQHERELISVPIPIGWSDSLRLLRNYLTQTIEKDCEKAFIQLAHQQYQWLIAPAMDALMDRGISRLLIVPDGELALVPFEALLYRPIQRLNGVEGMLLERFAIAYSYSSRMWLEQYTHQETAPQLFGGFGLEYDTSTLQYLEEIEYGKKKIQEEPTPCGTKPGNRSWGQLKYSDDEVQAIGELLAGETWLNEQATKDQFLANAAKYQLLHLAMHGSYDLDYPLNSALIFNRDQSDDIFLRSADIYELDLQANLVVLSACNSAFGAQQAGSAPLSLSRAFHYAGIPAAVASLWSIPDHSTAGIMVQFHQNLQAGQPKDVALQQAKLHYLESDQLSSPVTRDPAFWAANILIGHTTPLPSSRSTWPYWVAGGLAVLLLLLGIINRKKAAQNRQS